MRMARLAFILLLGIANQSQAAVKVLFLAYDDNSPTPVLNDILGPGGTDSRIDYANSVAVQSPAAASVTLAFLQQYDSVLFWADNTNPPPSVGDVLADYADAGGGVVLATFSGFYADFFAWGTSRINSGGYNPFVGPTTNAYDNVTLGTYDNGHPIMNGVSSLSSVYYNSDYTGVDAGATLVASWSNGDPLAGVNANGNVANIALFPDVQQFHHATGNYRELFRNALVFTASGAEAVPEPSTLAMFGLGGLGLAFSAFRRRFRKAA